ncbi:MAG: UDP-N-acetylmuramoyl-tripeptide--D-alanyl-D-alanine ligase, partial [Eubacteriales bacterium]|nr:UDP-N-acetylmuramoyl-tripeptide--D-alanyl-D-alanine ligase [Eubacteriales bacterium]
MIPITVRAAVKAANGEYKGNPEKIITGVFTDSRRWEENGLFAAIPGENTDGHLFVGELVSKGCVCLVSKEEYFIPGTVFVKNTKRAVYDIAAYYRNEIIPAVKVIAITGSVGKTTVKDMTGLVLNAQYNTYVTKGNSNSLLGVPVSVMSVNKEDEYAVLELGMSERGEIAALSKLVKPSVSIITNIGSSHLEALDSRENLIKEKFDILSGMEKQSGNVNVNVNANVNPNVNANADFNVVILDGDSEYEYSLKNKLYNKTVYCGITNGDSDFRAENIQAFDGKTVFDAVWGNSRQRVVLPAEGLHNVKNSLYAFAAGILCKTEPGKAAEALERFSPTGDRQRIYIKNGITVIADCYNASPESMKAAFAVLGSKPGRKIAVLGDMLELGDLENRFHADNALLAAETADIIIFVGSFASLCKSALRDRENVYAFDTENKHEAAALLGSLLKPGDIILFKGSRRIHIDDIIKEAAL